MGCSWDSGGPPQWDKLLFSSRQKGGARHPGLNVFCIQSSRAKPRVRKQKTESLLGRFNLHLCIYFGQGSDIMRKRLLTSCISRFSGVRQAEVTDRLIGEVSQLTGLC